MHDHARTLLTDILVIPLNWSVSTQLSLMFPSRSHPRQTQPCHAEQPGFEGGGSKLWGWSRICDTASDLLMKFLLADVEKLDSTQRMMSSMVCTQHPPNWVNLLHFPLPLSPPVLYMWVRNICYLCATASFRFSMENFHKQRIRYKTNAWDQKLGLCPEISFICSCTL